MVPGNLYREMQLLSVDFEYTVCGIYEGVCEAYMGIPVIEDVAKTLDGYDAIDSERTEVKDTPAFRDVCTYVRTAIQLQGLSLERITAIERIGRWD